MDKLASVTPVVVGVLGTHALLKLGFFLLPYPRRRAALDKSYGSAPSATRISDMVLLGMTVTLSLLLFWRGVDAVCFLGGIWIGATLIQLYFHQFHAPLPPDRAAPPVVSPIKMMSYAIQDSPWRPWRELLVLTLLIATSLVLMVTR
jgi:hypothetical protein